MNRNVAITQIKAKRATKGISLLLDNFSSEIVRRKDQRNYMRWLDNALR
jgi:hypothetical protein